jgi:hypothetical protein
MLVLTSSFAAICQRIVAAMVRRVGNGRLQADALYRLKTANTFFAATFWKPPLVSVCMLYLTGNLRVHQRLR